MERARRILFEVENAAKELSDHPSLGRRITVGAIPTVAPYLLPPLIRRCRKKYPALQIDVREDFRTQITAESLVGFLSVLVALGVAAMEYRLNWKSLFRR